MRLMNEIHKQSLGVRKTMFVLALVATAAFVGRIWFESFNKNLYAVLHPQEVAEQKYLAEQEDNPSIFSAIGGSFSGLKALISDAFDNTERNFEVEGFNNVESEPEEEYNALPLAPGR